MLPFRFSSVADHGAPLALVSWKNCPHFARHDEGLQLPTSAMLRNVTKLLLKFCRRLVYYELKSVHG